MFRVRSMLVTVANFHEHSEHLVKQFIWTNRRPSEEKKYKYCTDRL